MILNFFLAIGFLIFLLILGFCLFVSAIEKNEKVFDICAFIISVIILGVVIWGI